MAICLPRLNLGSGVGSDVFVGLGVSVGRDVGVGVSVGVGVGVGVEVGVGVAVGAGVSVGAMRLWSPHAHDVAANREASAKAIVHER
jgi:hypothetical protein